VALTYLLDTSVVTRLAAPAVADRLRALDPDGIGRTMLTDLEIGYSARNAPEWDRLIAAVELFPLVEIHHRDVERARQVQRLLAHRGMKGRKVPDLIIAAVAEAANLVVLHYDTDFDHIAAATGQRAEWIVTAGSVD
jgi:predicted nucleic acid-binding protein